MKVIDEGHIYQLDRVGDDLKQNILFLKRSDPAKEHDKEWNGPLVQEYLRALINRAQYLDGIIPCYETQTAITHLREALYQFEARAWRRKQQGVNKTGKPHESFYKLPPFGQDDIELLPVGEDGHVIT